MVTTASTFLKFSSTRLSLQSLGAGASDGLVTSLIQSTPLGVRDLGVPGKRKLRLAAAYVGLLPIPESVISE